MRHPTRIRQLHGFFDAEQIDNAQNLLKVAATARPPGAPGVANGPGGGMGGMGGGFGGGPLGAGSLPGGLGFPLPKL
jgi:RNA polymerase primary sigma factor